MIHRTFSLVILGALAFSAIAQEQRSPNVIQPNIPPSLGNRALATGLSPMNSGLPVNLISIVQKTNNKSTGSVASLAKAFAANTVKGNSLIVGCGVGNGTAPTISDTQSNTWNTGVQVANGTAFNVGIFYAVNTAGGADTITCNNGGTTASIAMEIYEVSGTIQIAPDILDATNSGTGTGTALSSGAVVPETINEYAFAVFGVGTAAQTITVTGGFTNDSGQQNPTTPTGLFSFVAASKFISGISTNTATATITSEPWAAAVATFEPVILGTGGAHSIRDGLGNNRSAGVDTFNNVRVGLLPTNVLTYAASKQGLVPAASPTDIAVLPGNGTNTVIVTRVWMSCTQTTAGIIDVQLIKRSTADTAGTSAAMTAGKMDSGNAAAVSAPLSYTANPTLGTADFTLAPQKIGVMAPATATPNDFYLWVPTMGQSVVLRTTAQQLAINLNGVTLTGGSCDLEYVWIETTGL